jgi:hypothetical protein
LISNSECGSPLKRAAQNTSTQGSAVDKHCLPIVIPSSTVSTFKMFFITLGGPEAHDSSVEKYFQEEPSNRRMTRGRAVLPGTVVA